MQKGDEVHTKTISKVGVLHDVEQGWQICEVVNNVKRFSSELNVNDLLGMVKSGIPSVYRPLYWYNFLQIHSAHKDDQTALNRYQRDPNSIVEGFQIYLDSSRSFKRDVECFFDEEHRKESLGRKRCDNFEKIMLAFSAYLQLNKIMNISDEENLRYILYRFIERVGICLHPTAEDNFSQLDFESDQSNEFKRLRSVSDRFGGDQDELAQMKNQQDLAETFWICVGLYNLQYAPMVAIGNVVGVDVLKEKLSRGLFAYMSLLSEEVKARIQHNGLEDHVFTCWVEAYTNLFDRFIGSPSMFARVLDVLIFEFEINCLDGFDSAVAATFATLLSNINFSAVYSATTLREAFQIQSLVLPRNFISQILDNIARLTNISQQFDATQLQKTKMFLRFDIFVAKLYPTSLNDYKMTEKVGTDFFNFMAQSRIQGGDAGDVDEFPAGARGQQGIPYGYQSNLLYQSKSPNPQNQLFLTLSNRNAQTLQDTQIGNGESDLNTIGTKKNKALLQTTYHLDRRHFNEFDQDQLEQFENYNSKPSIQNYKAFIPANIHE